MIEILEVFFGNLGDVLFGNWLIFTLVGVGIYYTYLTKFIQIRRFQYIVGQFLKGIRDKSNNGTNEISPVQALLAAIGSCVGSGNIVGVATAVIYGGPGALFWMWLAAFFGMATKFAEIVLGIKHRGKDKSGAYYGGPMFYISKAFRTPIAGIVAAVLLFIQNTGGTLIQSNTISNVILNYVHVSPVLLGGFLAGSLFYIVTGGFKRLVSVAQVIVPFMASFYVIIGLVVIIINIESLPGVTASIFSQAFSINAGLGAAAGMGIREAMRFGIARGLYSNEAGEGSASVMHSTASRTTAVEQGMFGVLEVFIDTMIICSVTGIAILSSGVPLVGANAATLASKSFSTVMPFFGVAVNISLLLFCLTSLLSQWYFGHVCLMYFNLPYLDSIYKLIYCIAIVLGSLGSIKLVWLIQDCALGLLIIPNLIALILLAPQVKSEISDYENQNRFKDVS